MILFNILLLLLLQVAIQSSHAFSATSTSDGGIKIVGLPGNQIESLPSMYVNTFRRWIVEDNNKHLTTTDSTNNNDDDSGRILWRPNTRQESNERASASRGGAEGGDQGK